MGGVYANDLYQWALLGSSGIALYAVVRTTDQGFRAAFGTILLFLFFFLIQTPFTLSGIWPTHLFILLPIPQMLVAGVVVLIVRSASTHRAAKLLAIPGVLIAGAIWVQDLRVDVSYHDRLGQTGGWSTYSDAIYSLSSFLKDSGGRPAFAMDWGMSANVFLLTQGEVHPKEIFLHSAEAPQGFYDELYQALMQHGALFVFHAPEITTYPRMQAFENLVRRMERSAVLEESFAQRDGKVIYLVYSVSG
jgi:hypothetical protein